MSKNENNTQAEITTIPPNFWRNTITWRTTNTGMNQNVIHTYAPHKRKKDIIVHMRENIIPYTDKRKYLNPEEKKKHDYFVEVVNDCMKDIWKGNSGFVFKDSQLKEVMMILPSVNVEWSEYSGGYYCWK
jgi:hypothetical protein